jgi:MSHA biogenesis protein MshN
MSLINQMLQDLDRRRAAANERSALPRHVRVLPARRRRRVFVVLAAAGGVACAVSALVWGFNRAAPVAAGTYTEAARSVASTMAEAEPRRNAIEVHEAAAATAVALPQSYQPAAMSAAPRERPTRRAHADDSSVVPRLVYSTALTVAASESTAPATAERAPNDRPASQQSDAAPPKIKAPPAEIEKRARDLNPQQIAENEYRAGATLLNNGRIADAQERFRAALQQQPSHVGARQALFGTLLTTRHPAEAEQVLQEGLKLNARQPGFAMALARLQTERGDPGAALETLQKAAPAAAGHADYLAFLAALLQRQERHAEAADHYHAALALTPASGVWQMGLGISLQALNRNPEAYDAFRRAKASGALNADLLAYVDERLRQLQRR